MTENELISLIKKDFKEMRKFEREFNEKLKQQL